jgi:hypothetical protein
MPNGQKYEDWLKSKSSGRMGRLPALTKLHHTARHVPQGILRRIRPEATIPLLSSGLVLWYPFQAAKLPEITFRAILTEGEPEMELV